jgi:hypothetical protein
VLEIGIGGYNACPGGNSLRMWRSYFPRATIYGLDLYEKRFEDAHRLVLLQGDQSDRNTLRRVVELCQPFDLVVDDGSHVRSDIIASFEALFPAVAPRGIYAIEDIDAVYPTSAGAEAYEAPDDRASAARLLSDDLRLGRWPIASVYSYPGLLLVEKGQY